MTSPGRYGRSDGEPPKPDRLMVQSQTAWRDVRKINVYDFIEQTYFGTQGYRDAYYLIPHPREAYYENRRASSCYNNIFRPVINAQVDDVFADEIRRQCDNEEFGKFIGNCDNCGTPLQNLIEDAMHYGRMHDVVFVVMDNYRPEEQPETAGEAIADRVMPYIYLKRAQDVKEWSTDKFGRLLSIDFRDEVLTETLPGEGGSERCPCPTYRHWETGKWNVYKIKMSEDGTREIKVVLEEGAIGIDVLPVIPMLDFARSDNLKAMPEPSSYDLAFLCFALFNKESEARTLEQYQAFSIFYAQGIDQQSMTIAPNNLWVLPNDARIPPGIISPNPDHLKNHYDSCDRIVQLIRSNAGQRGVLAAEPKSSASGISKQWDFRGEEKILRRTSLAAKNLEICIARLFQRYTGTTFDYVPEYPEKFDPAVNDNKVGQLTQLIASMPPRPFARAAWEWLGEHYFGSDEDTGNTLIADIGHSAMFAGKGAMPRDGIAGGS
jgi:hypothetical protein